MSSFNSISADKLWRLIGVPHGPALIDVRDKDDFAADPRFIPGAIRRPHETVSSWAPEFAGRSTVVICENGQRLKRRRRGLAASRAAPRPPKFLSAAMPPGRKRACRSCPKANCRRAIRRGERSG